MKILGGKGGRGRGGQRIVKYLRREYYGDNISNVGRYRWEGVGGEKEICVGGFIRPSKACGGCNVQKAGSKGWCWEGGSTGVDMQSAKLSTLSRNEFKKKREFDWVRFARRW